MKFAISKASYKLTAIVAAIFSVVICITLITDFTNRLTKVPLESPEFLDLKTRFAEDSQNEQLKADIRDLDLTLRERYFRDQQFTKRGVFLLLGSIGVMLIAGKYATTIKRKLPKPFVKQIGPDSDERLSRTGLWATTVLVVSLLAIVWGMNASYQSALPASLEELAALRKEQAALAAAASSSTDTPPTPVAAPSLPELPSAEEFAQSWPNFRGPSGSGISTHQEIPTEWDVEGGEGIVWKTPVPSPGLNSPIVWKDRVFLSGATKEAREVYCFDAATGEILWKKDITGATEDPAKPLKVSKDTGYAAPTMATDGRAVFALFADGTLVALDFTGNELWTIALGIPKNHYGHGTSLVTHNGNLIVQFDQGTTKDDLAKLIAFDGATGDPVWETARPKMSASWASPIVVEHDDKPQLITAGDPWVAAYSPVDGREIWRVECLKRAEVGPTPVYSDGMVYAGNENATFAGIRVDGTGDVTETHLQWEGEGELPDTCSPLVVGDVVLALASYGTLTCYDKKEGGDPLWEEDLGADFTSSPSLAGDKVILFSKEGTALIAQATRDEYKLISEAELGEDCVTSPAFQEGRIYIRGSKHLFCIGK